MKIAWYSLFTTEKAEERYAKATIEFKISVQLQLVKELEPQTINITLRSRDMWDRIKETYFNIVKITVGDGLKV